MQVEHKTEKGTVLFVKVPDDAHKFILRQNKSNSDLWFNHGLPESIISSWIELPVLNWQLIGLTIEITEEKVNMIGLVSVSNFRKEIENLQVYEVNPLDKPKEDKTVGMVNLMDFWNYAESRTGKWIVLFKPE